eukprot:scaffold24012_cov186-Cylindrotheca_fusiformis.AAC.2
MKFYLATSLFVAMGATTNAFQPIPSAQTKTALFSSAPMNGAPPPKSIEDGPGASVPGNPGQSGGLAGRNTRSGPPPGPGPDTAPLVTIQGGSLKTWSLPSFNMQSVQLLMKTEGRPLDSEIDLWQGPDNTPYKLRIYVEDGAQRTFNVIVPAPRGPNTVCIRNTANLEFPLLASVNPSMEAVDNMILPEGSTPRTIQGGALRTYPFNPDVQSVKVMLTTDGRPLNSRIELLQGPNNIKQVMELYTEDGLERPFFAIVETPGAGNVVRIVNTATMEFPLTAMCEPHMVGPEESMMDQGAASMSGNMIMGNDWMY